MLTVLDGFSMTLVWYIALSLRNVLTKSGNCDLYILLYSACKILVKVNTVHDWINSMT